jgi:signal transduction histidine kinase
LDDKLIIKKNRRNKNFLLTRTFLVLLGFFLIFSSFFLGKTQESRNLSQIYSDTASRARTYSSETKTRYQNIYDALDRLAKKEEPSEVINNDEWRKDAAFYVDAFEGIKRIMWIDKTFQIRRIVPLQDNESYINQNASEIAVNPSDFTLLIPIFNYGTELKGFIFGTINIEAFIGPVIRDLKNDYVLQILNEGIPIFTSKTWKQPKKEFIIKEIMTLRNAEVWNLTIAPTNELLSSEILHSRKNLLFYLFISFIAIIAVYFMQNYSARSKLLERTKENLERSQAQLKETQEQLIRKEKLAAIGQLAGSVGHELRNPLGVIGNSIYYLNMILKDPDKKVLKQLKILKREIKRSDDMISDLLDFSRVQSPTLIQSDLNTLIKNTIAEINIPEQIRFEMELDESLPLISLDSKKIEQVIQNMVANAIGAISKQGKVEIKTRKSDDFAEIIFHDNGEGIPKENLNKIFEPLFTTKAKGIGLGLAIIKNIIESHHGKIEVENKVGEGTTFIIKLPLNKSKIEGGK